MAPGYPAPNRANPVRTPRTGSERPPSRHPATDRPVYEFFLPEVLVRFAVGRVIGRGTTPAAARTAAEQVARQHILDVDVFQLVLSNAWTHRPLWTDCGSTSG
ncbi:hypothetical protein [Amycolatopsis plumensis]|uniref:Uncharacterized protein n=1 Tax=Amycolatopsis plumensis TaxID=236508 RepID=A0ABV5UCU0_9PSEU